MWPEAGLHHHGSLPETAVPRSTQPDSEARPGNLLHLPRPQGGSDIHTHGRSTAAHSQGTAWPPPHSLPLLTFVVESPIEVVAPGIEAGGMLDEMPSPGVPGAWEAGQSHEHFGLGGQEPPVGAPSV